jgi:sulfatase modifying factor 1
MTQLRIGRFENLVAWLATLIDQKSKQIESTLIQEIEQDWRSWWLDHCVYHGDSVIVDDWRLLINRWMNLAFFQMGDISKTLVLGLDTVRHDQAKMIEFIEDFSCSERDDLNAKIRDIEVAMERMVGYFGEDIRKKRVKVRDKKKQNANGVEFEMVYCPAGEFWIDPPKHLVKMTKGFWMGEIQVTQELWEKVMGWNPSKFKGSGKLPVEYVTWYDCLVFCNKLSELEKFKPCFTLSNIEEYNDRIMIANVEWNRHANGYRLPTEAEWEYSAKAGMELTYSGSNKVDEVAWYHANSGYKTHEVKTKKANGWGLYDMTGNVWEWCMDKFDEESYQSRKNGIENPILWENSPCARVVRGGSYWSSAGHCRVAYRSRRDADYRNDLLGLRLLRCEP